MNEIARNSQKDGLTKRSFNNGQKSHIKGKNKSNKQKNK